MNSKNLSYFVNIFLSSNYISTEKERSKFLLKTAGKRGCHEVIEEDAEKLHNYPSRINFSK